MVQCAEYSECAETQRIGREYVASLSSKHIQLFSFQNTHERTIAGPVIEHDY